jgi:GNAT superfamily N-acetyltransferase
MDISFRHLDGERTRAIANDIVATLYEATHAQQLEIPFYSVSRFLERLEGYTAAPGFALVLATDEAGSGRPVGQAFGYPLPPGARWWNGIQGDVPAGFTREDGKRTYALNELMVHPEYQRRGVARMLHDTLMRSRTESRATLLVRADNAAARSAYFHWGWRVATKLQPFPDSPIYDALILDLPITQ